MGVVDSIFSINRYLLTLIRGFKINWLGIVMLAFMVVGSYFFNKGFNKIFYPSKTPILLPLYYVVLSFVHIVFLSIVFQVLTSNSHFFVG